MTKIPTWRERSRDRAEAMGTPLGRGELGSNWFIKENMQAEIADLRKELTKARRNQRAPDCKWARHDYEDIWWWAAQCGYSPADHTLGIKFCPGCGGRVRL